MCVLKGQLQQPIQTNVECKHDNTASIREILRIVVGALLFSHSISNSIAIVQLLHSCSATANTPNSMLLFIGLSVFLLKLQSICVVVCALFFLLLAAFLPRLLRTNFMKQKTDDRKQITDAVAYFIDSTRQTTHTRKTTNSLFYGVKLPIQAIWYSN